MKEELIQDRIRRLFEAKEQQTSPLALKETDRSIKMKFNAKDTYEIKINEKKEYDLEKNGKKVRYNELPKEEQKLIRNKIEKGHVIFAEKEKEPEKEISNFKKTINKENKPLKENKEKEEHNKAGHTQTLAQQERRRQLLEQKKKEEQQRAQAETERKAVAIGITAAALQQAKYHSYDDMKVGLDMKGLPTKYMEVGEALNEIADSVSLEGQEKGSAFLALNNGMSFAANEKGDVAVFMDDRPIDEISSVLKISSETIDFTQSAEIGLSDFSGISLEHSGFEFTGVERL